MRIYGDLAEHWYPLLDPREDHAHEAKQYAAWFASKPPKRGSLLELGSGAGNAAWFLKRDYDVTLCDLSESMLSISRRANPECEHVLGDMRTVRLGRTFDGVFIHDALSYLTTRDDLRAALQTAFEHVKPGGKALFAPDEFREDFYESCELHEAECEGRALRCIEWFWDPDPTDDTCVGDYVFALRENGETRVVHDRHVVGIFPRQLWLDTLRDVGFEVTILERSIEGLEGPYTDEVFGCVRPG